MTGAPLPRDSPPSGIRVTDEQRQELVGLGLQT